MLKAIVNERGWEHRRHRHYLQAISGLRSETGDAEIRSFFNSASALDVEYAVNVTPGYSLVEQVAHGVNEYLTGRRQRRGYTRRSSRSVRSNPISKG